MPVTVKTDHDLGVVGTQFNRVFDADVLSASISQLAASGRDSGKSERIPSTSVESKSNRWMTIKGTMERDFDPLRNQSTCDDGTKLKMAKSVQTISPARRRLWRPLARPSRSRASGRNEAANSRPFSLPSSGMPPIYRRLSTSVGMDKDNIRARSFCSGYDDDSTEEAGSGASGREYSESPLSLTRASSSPKWPSPSLRSRTASYSSPAFFEIDSSYTRRNSDGFATVTVDIKMWAARRASAPSNILQSSQIELSTKEKWDNSGKWARRSSCHTTGNFQEALSFADTLDSEDWSPITEENNFPVRFLPCPVLPVQRQLNGIESESKATQNSQWLMSESTTDQMDCAFNRIARAIPPG